MPPLRRLACLTVALVLPLCSCTIRYSQSMVGSIQRISPRPVSNSDSGFGIGLHPTLLTATLSEPRSADELMTLPCDVALTEVDYRALFYAFYISFVFPEVKDVAYCVESTSGGS